MPLYARQPALLRPAAIAIHDYGDMIRQPLGIEAGVGETLKGFRSCRRSIHSSFV